MTTLKNTPNCELANIITDALLSEELISEKKHKDVLFAIIDGNIKNNYSAIFIS